MKLGIFSDVHGNIYAFEKAWGALQRESCDLYCFLGDVCGYYYHQNEVIDILRGIKNMVLVRGNHDGLFLQIAEDHVLEKEYSAKYGKSCSILKKSITGENLDFIRGMPEQTVLNEYNTGIFHGSPWDYLNEYVYPDAALDRFKNLSFDFVLMGHTHYAMHHIVDGMHIINPGSCGQPRDTNLPSYATIDMDKKEVRINRFVYDVNKLMNDINKNKESNMYLKNVLLRD